MDMSVRGDVLDAARALVEEMRRHARLHVSVVAAVTDCCRCGIDLGTDDVAENAFETHLLAEVAGVLVAASTPARRPPTNQPSQRPGSAYPATGFRGVRPPAPPKRYSWEARIKVKGKQHHLGSFPSAEAAASAYDRAARDFYGPNAHLNFPGKEPAS